MSLESIISHIIEEANGKREKIVQEARHERDTLIQAARGEAEKLYQEIMDREKSFYLSQKQKLIVNARLERKSNLLKAKQESIDRVFEKIKSNLGKDVFKKEEVTQDSVQEVRAEIDFYLNKFRFDYESEIAKILFG